MAGTSLRVSPRGLLAYDVLVATSLIWFLAQLVRYVFPTLFGTFSELYGVSNTTLGLLFTTMMLAYTGMQFPSGALADRLGTSRVIVAGALVAVVGALVAFAVRGFPALVVAAVLIGAGTGAHKTVAINLLSRVYPGQTGGLLGTMDAIGHLGGAAGPTAVALVFALGLGWPNVFLLVAVVGVGLVALFRDRVARRPASAVTPEVDRDDPDGGGHGVRDYLAPFRDRRLSAFLLVTVAHSLTFNGFVAFLPLYLETEVGLSRANAGLLFASLFVMALVQPFTGGLADRVGRYEVQFATLGLEAVSLLTLLVAPVPALVLLAVPLVGLGGHGFRPVRDAYLVETIPDRVGGGTLGVARTVMIGAGSVAPAIVGFLSDVAGFRVAFFVLVGVAATGTTIVAALLVVDRRY